MASETILVASANQRWATSMATLLAGEGYRVCVARTGVDALYQARMRRPELVFLAPELPQLDGWSICARLAGGEFPHVRIVMVTDDGLRAYRAGAHGYVVPCGEIELSLPPVRAFRAPDGVLRDFLHRRQLAA